MTEMDWVKVVKTLERKAHDHNILADYYTSGAPHNWSTHRSAALMLEAIAEALARGLGWTE